MIILSAGFGKGTITIVFILSVILLLMMIKRKYAFKLLSFLNKKLLPSLYKKDITKLKGYEKLLLAYKYWVTKNSL